MSAVASFASKGVSFRSLLRSFELMAFSFRGLATSVEEVELSRIGAAQLAPYEWIWNATQMPEGRVLDAAVPMDAAHRTRTLFSLSAGAPAFDGASIRSRSDEVVFRLIRTGIDGGHSPADSSRWTGAFPAGPDR